MDEELKTFLVAMETRTSAKFQEAAKQLDALESRFDGKLHALESRMDEKLHDMETRLLTEFWKWGRNAEQRIRRVEHSDSTTAERMALLEDRVFTLERKVAGSKE